MVITINHFRHSGQLRGSSGSPGGKVTTVCDLFRPRLGEVEACREDSGWLIFPRRSWGSPAVSDRGAGRSFLLFQSLKEYMYN